MDKATLTSANLIVRPIGGEAVKGSIATQTGIVNFSPESLLLPNTTYEVIVKAGGIKDYAGNGVPAGFRSLVSTGTEISTGLHAPPRDAAFRPTLYPGLRALPNGIAAGDAGETLVRWVDIRGRVLPLRAGPVAPSRSESPEPPVRAAGEP